jgi:hypothetical protein
LPDFFGNQAGFVHVAQLHVREFVAKIRDHVEATWPKPNLITLAVKKAAGFVATGFYVDFDNGVDAQQLSRHFHSSASFRPVHFKLLSELLSFA